MRHSEKDVSKKKQMQLPEGTTLRNLFKKLKIPAEQVGILLVNGLGAVHEPRPSEGLDEQKSCPHDVVSIFPLIAGG